MLTALALRVMGRDPHGDAPYIAFAAGLLDFTLALALWTLFGPTAGGALMTINIIGWVLALSLGNRHKRAHARHLNRKALR